MKNVNFRLVWIPALVLLFAVGACSSGNRLDTTMLRGAIPGSGPVHLILYTGNYGDDPQKAGFLDLQDDAYTIKPYGMETLYKVLSVDDMTKAEATAKEFLGRHRSAIGSETRSISGPDGTVIGYEVRPLYQPIDLGQTDVLDISYVLKEDGLVLVYISMKPMRKGPVDHTRDADQ